MTNDSPARNRSAFFQSDVASGIDELLCSPKASCHDPLVFAEAAGSTSETEAAVTEPNTCPRCGSCAWRADERNSVGCYSCRATEHYIGTALRHCGLEPIPGAKLWDCGSIVANIGPLEVSHSGRGYWRVKGPVPLWVAQFLYADPAGRGLIRVDGDCTCPAPEGNHIEWRMPGGSLVLPLHEYESAKLYASRPTGLIADIAKTTLETCLFHDDPASVGASGFVMQYHIDGDLGLRVFVDIVRKHGEATSA